MGIGKRIKEAREMRNLTQAQLADKIGITPSSITNYENGTSHPKEPILYKLMNALSVDANFLFQDEMKANVIAYNAHEESIIETYRSLDPLDKKAVDGLLDTLSEREKQLIKEQSKDSEYAKEFIVLEPPKVIPRFPKLASAGTGEYLFNDIPSDMIETDNYEADFALGVFGKSMEPKYSEDDYVLVKKQDAVNMNDIAIYIIDGECLIKQFKGDHLHSLNPEFDDIAFNENQNIKCVGKVLGKV